MRNAQVEVCSGSGLNSGCVCGGWERGGEGKMIWDARAGLGHSNDWLGRASPQDRRQDAACGHGQRTDRSSHGSSTMRSLLSAHHPALLLQSDPLLPPPVATLAIERRHGVCCRGLLVPFRSGTICGRLRPSAARLAHGQLARNSEHPRFADRFDLHHAPLQTTPAPLGPLVLRSL